MRSGSHVPAVAGASAPCFTPMTGRQAWTAHCPRETLVATHDAERGRALAASNCCAELGAFIGAVLTASERGRAGQCSEGPVGASGGAPVAGAIEEAAAAVGCGPAIG